MEEGSSFSLCVSSHHEVYPILPHKGYPHSRSGWGVGRGEHPIPSQDMGGTPIPGQEGEGVPPSQVKLGVPTSPHPGQDGEGYPQPEQHSMSLLRSRQYACCVRAGGMQQAVCLLCSCRRNAAGSMPVVFVQEERSRQYACCVRAGGLSHW